jgi:cytochrome oxidase Cu insertion factor (SCO1/SenC/PrrC family)
MRSRVRSSVFMTTMVLLTMLVLSACSRTAPHPSAVSNGPARVGERAPTFTLPSAGGGPVSLSEFAGKKSVLLFFSMGPG